VAGIGSWSWNIETDEVIFSDNLFRLYGLEPGQITGLAQAFELVHPDDLPKFERAEAAARGGGPIPSFEFRLADPEFESRRLRLDGRLIESPSGESPVVVGVTTDVTEYRVAEYAIAAHIAVAEALNQWSDFTISAPVLLQHLAEAMEKNVGVFWLRDDSELACRAFWASDPQLFGEFQDATEALRFPRGVGLPGRVWETATPVHIERLKDDPEYRRVAVATRAGLQSAVALPVAAGGEVMGALEFLGLKPWTVSDLMLATLTGIGYEVGEFLGRRRGELGPPPLTRRELEVLQLAAAGTSGPEIAATLIVSTATVKTHFENIYAKLGVSDRAGAVAEALRLGIIT
jgi:DNA-binding CsgD family transcriptional regulator